MQYVSPSTVIGYCRPTHTFGVFTDSLARLISHDALSPTPRLTHPDPLIVCESGPRVAEARNMIVREFLAGDADWLWMLDVDLSFPVDTLDKLMATADPDTRPLVAGLYFARGDANQGLFPVLGVFDKDGEICRVNDYPRGQVIKAHTTGAGCLLMHRAMLEHVGEMFKESRYPWFTEGLQSKSGDGYGEDEAFLLRCHLAGYELWIDTGLGLGHVKTVELTEGAWWAIRENTQAAASSPRPSSP